MNRPYLSVVAVTRNDDYGAGLLAKLQTFQRTLAELCTDAQIGAEIVLVEWNPPPERPALAEVVESRFLRSAQVTTRILTVPPAIHEGLPMSSRRQLFEYLGKNAGIRRAAGEFILATNPDTVFSRQLVDRFQWGRLREDRFYRVDRTDVAGPVPENVCASEVEEYCRQNVLRFQGHWIGDKRHNPTMGDWIVHAPAILRRMAGALVTYRTCVPLHCGAPGDFLLMHRRNWHQMRGFAELELLSERSHHLDTLAVMAARYHGLRQEVFGSHCVLYHQEHDRPEAEKPWTESIQFAYDAMRALHQPWVNPVEWGLGEHVLPEQVVRGVEAARERSHAAEVLA